MKDTPSPPSSFLSPLKLAWFILFACLIALVLWLTYAPPSLQSRQVIHVQEQVFQNPPSIKEEEIEAEVSEIESLLPVQEEFSFQETLTPQKDIEVEMLAEEETPLPIPEEAPSSLPLQPVVSTSVSPGTKNLLAWQMYGQPSQIQPKGPLVAIVINGLGMSLKSTTQAINELPPEVTLAFLPYTTSLKELITQARLKGHEIMLTLPMEPLHYPQQDSGPYTLLTHLSRDENLKRLRWLLAQGKEYVGVTNLMGSKFLADEAALKPFFSELQEQGLFFLENQPLPSSQGTKVSSRLSNPLYLNQTFTLDTEASRLAIGRQLSLLEEKAKSQGYAIGIGLGYDITLKQLKIWIKTLKDKGITLVPITFLLKEKGQPSQKSLAKRPLS